MNAPQSSFSKEKGVRLARAIQDALHPIVNDKGLTAIRLVFLYEADGQTQGGSLDLQVAPGAGAFLEEAMRQRLAQPERPAHKVTNEHQQMVKS